MAGRDPPSFTRQDMSQQRHLQEENAILKEELQRLTSQLVASEDKTSSSRIQGNEVQDVQQLLHANSLLQAKVDMLRDLLKAARVTASEKAALESEVAQLKQRLAAPGRSRSGVASRTTSQVLDGEAHAVTPIKQTRSLSEDGGSQSQLWMQLDSLQKENARLAEANHLLNFQLVSANAQRAELQARWAERERCLAKDLTSAKEEVSKLTEKLREAEEQKPRAEVGPDTESLNQTNRMLTDQIRSLQAKADEARQTVEIVSAENAQLAAHVQLLESELEAVQAGSLGQQLGSNENSPRGTVDQPLPFGESHAVTPKTAAAQQRAEPAEDGASPAFSVNENPAFDQEGIKTSRPSTAGSREDTGSAKQEGTPAKTEADFQFSSLKRKWHAEEGKYLATELRRAQDLNVQQEMELESLRQQVAALSSTCSTEELDMLRERAAQAHAAERHVEALSAEVAALQEHLEGLHGQDARVAELQREVQRLAARADEVPAAPMEAQENGSKDNSDSSTAQPVGAVAEQTGVLAAREGNEVDRLDKPHLGIREDVEARAKKAQEETAELRQQLAELEEHLTAEKLRSNDTSSRLQAQAAQQEELQRALELKAAREHELESSVAEFLQLKQALEVRDKEAAALSQQLLELQAELLEARKHQTAAEEENKNKLQETQASLHTAQKDLEELQSVVESERASAADKYAALAQAYLTIDQVKADADAKQKELLRLKADIEAAEQASQLSTADLQTRLAAVSSELTKAQVALSQKDQQYAALETRTLSAQTQIASLQDQLNQLSRSYEGAQAAVHTQHSDQVDTAVQREVELTGQLAAAQAKVMQAQTELTVLQTAVSNKDAEIVELNKKLEAASARADGHYAALQEINEKLQEIQRSYKEAMQKSTAAAQEKEQAVAEMANMEKSHAAERNGLKEKLERLQRANKQRRGEIEEMQTKLSAMHQRASGYDQACQELQQLRKELVEVKPLAAAHPQLVEELSASRAEVKAAEKRIANFDALAKKAATVFEARLSSVERERDQLLEQVAVLKSATVANEALQAQAAAAQRELSAALDAAATAASHQQRAAAAEKAADEARKELQAAQAAAAGLEERLQAAEEEMDRITGAVEEERTRRAAAARAYAEELEGLPLKPVSAWPGPVRALVRQREAAAAEASAAAVRQEASTAEAVLEAELDRARADRDRAETERQQAIAAREKADAHTAAVSKELAEREQCLRAQLEAAQTEAAAANEAHEAEVAELRQTLELRVATIRADVADWQARAEAAEKELAAVKERAWALMEEKDSQLQAARAQKNHAAEDSGGVESPLPLSHSATMSTVQAALPHSGQITGGSGESVTSQHNRNTMGDASLAAGDEVSALKERILLLEKELVESENTHRLRDQAQAVAKLEIAELQRKAKREGLDLTYLKNVILGGFASGELPANSSMLPVLGRLLEFSSEELDRVRNPRKRTSA
ncbi:g11738 [Coccomyxa elongata]